MTKQLPLISLYIASEEDMTRFGGLLARMLIAGDTLLLDGPIGSGKSHLARAIIREKLGRDEDVPSPTFTLVQTYDLPGGQEIWHADLYRLTHPDEVIELGLDHAFGQAICVVEWPDRLGSLIPKEALAVRFSDESEGRRLSFGGGPEWSDRIMILQRAWHG